MSGQPASPLRRQPRSRLAGALILVTAGLGRPAAPDCLGGRPGRLRHPPEAGGHA
jgi:hypothetical protein